MNRDLAKLSTTIYKKKKLSKMNDMTTMTNYLKPNAEK